MARRVTLGLVAALAVVVLGFAVYILVAATPWKTLGTQTSAPRTKATNKVTASLSSGSSLASGVESDYNTNNATAPYAAQQQVVNGWAAKDALEGLLRQTDVLSSQNADLGAQVADNTNLLAARLDSLSATVTALLTIIALMAAAGCLLLLAIAIALMWKGKPSDASATAVEAQSVEALAGA